MVADMNYNLQHHNRFKDVIRSRFNQTSILASRVMVPLSDVQDEL
jgi:hypothetical protein